MRGIERLADQIHDARRGARAASGPMRSTRWSRRSRTKLDAARQLPLARDRWALRAPELPPVPRRDPHADGAVRAAEPSLEDGQGAVGIGAGDAQRHDQRDVAQILTLAAAIAPPEELASAHALLISAVQLAGNAAQIRREAMLAERHDARLGRFVGRRRRADARRARAADIQAC